jgi:hypothetical protein
VEYIVKLALHLKLVVMVVVLKKKIKEEKVNGVAKLGFAVLKKRIYIFVMNVKNFHAKNILKN